MRPSAVLPSLLVLSLSFVATPARATYSLLIADTKTGLLGSVGTSCVGASSAARILGVAPGFGAIHAQAQSNAQGRDRGVMMLGAGASADEVISAITASSFDFLASARQYGVVTLSGSAAGYTGATNGVYAEDRQLTLGDYVSSFQGNILTSKKVLDQLADSLREGAACDLPETLMRALEAGAENGEGDSRCTPRDIPADSGFLKVVARDGKELISLDVTSQGSTGAVVALRKQFDSWRQSHPCVSAPADAGITREDAGSALPDEPADTPVLDAASPRDAAVRDAASKPSKPGRDASADTQVEDEPDDEPEAKPERASSSEGCSTRGSTGQAYGSLLGALAVLLAGRRRRR